MIELIIPLISYGDSIIVCKTEGNQNFYELPILIRDCSKRIRLQVKEYVQRNYHISDINVGNNMDEIKYDYNSLSFYIYLVYVKSNTKSMINDTQTFEKFEYMDVSSIGKHQFEDIYRYILQNSTKINVDFNYDSFNKKIEYIEEPMMPFPQADNFENIIKIFEFLKTGKKRKIEIEKLLGLVSRQADYYINACKYLGIIVCSSFFIELSDYGELMSNMEETKMINAFIMLIRRHKVFDCVYSLKNISESMVLKSDIVEIMKNFELYNITSDDTYYRRAGTVNSWTDWIINQEKRLQL